VTLNVVILKDVGMAVTFLAAFGALFWYRSQHREPPPAVVAITSVLLLYGSLVRANAVFAVVPLFVYLIRPQWLSSPLRIMALSVPIALALVPVASLVNHHILHAEPLRPIRSLQIFDIAGIAFYSGDAGVLGQNFLYAQGQLNSCYVPSRWDRLAPWGECRFFWNRLAVSLEQQEVVEKLDVRSAMGAEPNPDLLHLWAVAIFRHPMAYVQHRLAYFGSEIVRGASMGAPDEASPKPPYVVFYDGLTASALWLAIGAGLLVRLRSSRLLRQSTSIDAALALILSGLLYAFAYLVIGVATELRYLFWSLIAIFAAAAISLSDLKGRQRAQRASSIESQS
jgi:hypothetical protein